MGVKNNFPKYNSRLGEDILDLLFKYKHKVLELLKIPPFATGIHKKHNDISTRTLNAIMDKIERHYGTRGEIRNINKLNSKKEEEI